MYIKRYTISVILFVILLGWYVYGFVTQQSIEIGFLGLSLPSMPIAVLVIIPLILLYVATIFHMAFYSLLGSFKVRKYEKDLEKMMISVGDALLCKENRHFEFKTPKYKQLGKVIDHVSMIADAQMPSIEDEKLANVLRVVSRVKSGEVADLRKFSLPTDNELMIQNDKNRYDAHELSPEDVLGKTGRYSKELCIRAYVDASKKSAFSVIEKNKEFINHEALSNILSRINADQNQLDLSNQALIELIGMLELNEKDYISISQALSKSMIPEQRIKLFELLSEKDDEATGAYLYTLYDLEMQYHANEILSNTQANEYLNFKAYRALKECNRHYDISLFV
ncbi:MAG: hypothetical protein PHX13_00300 [Thiovulaceae bacterium]|nr:hypothetical protein [Sulfurimonadaceae bacterium]